MGQDASEVPSLAAIKGLARISNSAAQLELASRHCNHAARAEMILRWMFDKPVKQQRLPKEPGFWCLLSRAARLIAPARLAPLLSPIDIFGVAQDILQTATAPSTDWLKAAAQCFNLLYEIAASTGAGPLKSTLSIDSQRAASFVNTWFIAILRHLGEATSNQYMQVIIDPALQVWSQRKYDPEDSAHFAETCLESAAQLQSYLASREVPHGPSRKRPSSESVSSSAPSSRDAVESLLARHVFIPARVSFFRAHDRAGMNSTISRQSATAGLKGLAQLQPPVDQQDSLGLERYNITISNLLDIAYRCTPLTTPKQRIREKPWIEAVFRSLSSSFNKLHKQEDIAAASCNLLLGVRRPCLLSKDVLIDIHDAHARINEVGTVEWRLIAHIAALQPTIYTEPDRAAQLFDSISLESEPNALSIITSQIIKPIINAFSETRALSTVIDLWHVQLCKKTAAQTCLTFPEVQEAFSSQVEATFSSGQSSSVLQRLEVYLGRLIGLSARAGPPDDLQSHLPADMIVLRSIIRGMVDDALLDVMAERIRQAFYSLSSLVEIVEVPSYGTTCEMTLWALLADLLRIWFPRWACEQDTAAILAEVAAIQSSPAVQKASDLVKREQSKARYGGYGEHALELVLVAVILTPPGSESDPKHAHTALKKLNPTVIARMLICRPQLINVRPDLFPKALEHCVSELRGSKGTDLSDEQELEDAYSRQRLLDGLVSAGISSQNDTVTELLVSTAEKFLSLNADDGDGAAQAFIGLLMLAELKPTDASEGQRRRICSRLVKLTSVNFPAARVYEEMEQRRLSALLRWMPTTHFGSDMSAEDRDAFFWSVAGTQGEREHGIAESARDAVEQLETTDLLDAALRSIFRHAVLPKGHAKSMNDRLSATNKSLSQHIGRFCAMGPADFDSHLAVAVRVSISEAGQTPGESDTNPAQHATYHSEIEKYADKLVSVLEGSLEQRNRDAFVLCVVLDSLADLSRIENDREFSARLRERLHSPVSRLLSEGGKDVRAGFGDGTLVHTTLARCFALACAWRLAPQPKTLPDVAGSLISQHLTPKDYLLVLDSFRQAIQRMLDGGAKVALIENMLLDDDETSLHALVLVQEVLVTIQNSDLESIEPGRAQQAVKRLLDFVVKPKTSSQACAAMVTILREKPFLVGQYMLEATMAALSTSVQLDSEHKHRVRDCCLVLQLILQQYRSRVQDRMHLLSRLVQDMFTCFGSGDVSVTSAATLSRVLQLLCDPPRSRSNRKGRDLVDEARQTRAKVGKYMQYVLHSYCVAVLKDFFSGDAREALKPGLWAVMAAMETDNADAIKTLSSSMNNSERAVLRATYQDYETGGKWSGK